MSDIINARTVFEALETAAKESPAGTMLIYEDRKISFQEVNELSERVACGLLKLGFKKGDKIGIIGLNQPEWVYTYFAAAKIGMVVTGLSVRYRDTELDYIINQSETDVVLSLGSLLELDYISFFDSFKSRIPSVKKYIYIAESGPDGCSLFADLLKTEIDTQALEQAKSLVVPEDTMMIIYTSGTTGKPKGAVISHKSQLASATAQAIHTKVNSDDLIPLALPFNHVGGITCGILTTLLGKGTCILIPMFSPDYVVDILKKYKTTMATGVPTIHTLLLMNETFNQLDLSNTRLVVTGGSNADSTLLTKLQKVYPNATIMNLYGLSETSGMVVMSPWDSNVQEILDSIGQTVGDVKLKLIDEKGIEVKQGDVGELCFSGEAVVTKYYGMPEQTSEAFADGWLNSGDMGLLDEKGNIILMGRKKEMFLQGGFNVYPIEIENHIASHPKVAMVAGIGVPDAVLGEIGRYFIVPVPHSDLTESEILDHCKEHLADYKVPKEIVFKEELPLSPAGKIMKSAL